MAAGMDRCGQGNAHGQRAWGRHSHTFVCMLSMCSWPVHAGVACPCLLPCQLTFDLVIDALEGSRHGRGRSAGCRAVGRVRRRKLAQGHSHGGRWLGSGVGKWWAWIRQRGGGCTHAVTDAMRSDRCDAHLAVGGWAGGGRGCKQAKQAGRGAQCECGLCLNCAPSQPQSQGSDGC